MPKGRPTNRASLLADAAAEGARASRRRGLRTLVTVLGLALALGAGWLAIRNADLGEVEAALAESDYWWLVPAFGAFAAAVAMRAVRWQALFRADARPPLVPVAIAMILGQFFNNVMPARAGEAARVIALHRMTRASRAETAGTVVLERVFDVLSLLLLFLVLFPALPEVRWLRAAIALALVLAVGLGLAVAVLARFGDRPFRAVLAPLARTSLVSRESLDRTGSNLAAGFAGLREPRLALVAAVWTVSSWLALGAAAWLVTLGFDFEVSPAAGLLVVIATSLAMIVPSAPAALGVFEGAIVVALAPFDVSASHALSYALVFHALNVVPFLLVGGAVLVVAAVRAHSPART